MKIRNVVVSVLDVGGVGVCGNGVGGQTHLSRCGTGITKVVTQRTDKINNFQAQNPLWTAARTPLLEVTPRSEVRE